MGLKQQADNLGRTPSLTKSIILFLFLFESRHDYGVTIASLS